MGITIKFIDVAYLKANTSIEQNVDDSKLNPYIIKANETHIQQALGSSFYNHLGLAISGGTLTANENSLITDYIQPALAEFAYYEAYPHIGVKSTNKGNVQQNSDNSISVDLAWTKYLRGAILDIAEFQLKRLNNELVLNSNLYPEYTNPSSPENLPRNSKSFFGGMYIPKGHRHSGYKDKRDCNNC